MTIILHTADVHLDRAFSGIGMASGMAARRRQELRDAVIRLVDLAIETRADALTIGGDLYEHERLTLDTGNFLRQQFERVAPAKVLIAPGNHDPYVPDSLYRRIEWPRNVTIFAEPRFRPVELSPDLTVWGAAHNGPAVMETLLRGFRVQGAGRHILLFHGSDMHAVPEGKPAHAPFMPEDIAATGADFALLGHYHGARLHPSPGPRFAYPGSPEPLDFAESGEHYILKLTVAGSGVTPELVPFGNVRYVTYRVDVTAMQTSEEVRAAILALAGDPAITRVVLEGQLSPDVDLDVEAVYNACVERFTYLDIQDRTQPAYDFDSIADESTTRGAFVRLLQARMAAMTDAERQVAEAALVHGLRAFERREVRL